MNGARIMIKYVRLIFAIPLFLFSVASLAQQTSPGSGDPELEAKVYTALQHLFDTAPRARDLRYKAKAILVFPDILKAGFIVGAQGGKGVMFGPDGKVLGYYTARAVSYGLQAGGQKVFQTGFPVEESGRRYLTADE